ncbi:MAG: LynF/TruF/PatF family peptide O-prenyltransferase [Spirulina sp.]
MISEDRMSIDRNSNLYHIAQHKRIFEVEEFLYPLPIFENFVRQAANWELECSCKIQGDYLYPARFNLSRFRPQFRDYQLAWNFFRQVESRVGVKLNEQLLSQFVGSDFDFSKIQQILLGVDLRQEIDRSRLKFWFVFSDYPQKLATAITLCEPHETIQKLLVEGIVIVGFDLFLNGRSEIEVYPRISAEQFQQIDIQRQLTTVLSRPALKLLENCGALGVGFSRANREKVLYYRTRDANNFIANLSNDIANRVHAYYRQQPVHGTIIGLQESEILSGSIQNINLYYHMRENSR